MPLFGSKFTTFKYSKRKNLPFRSRNSISENLGDPIKIKLGSYESLFTDGEWKTVTEPKNELRKENEYLKEVQKQLKEENNFLKMKIDVLINMLIGESFKSQQRKEVTF